MGRAQTIAFALAAALVVAPLGARAEAPAAEARESSVSDWGWVMVLAGAATLAASATFALRATSDHEDWVAARDPDRKARLKTRGESRSSSADITGVAGLVTVATGAVLVWTF